MTRHKKLAVFVLAALIAVFPGFPSAARASSDPLFTVQNVRVDVTAESAAAARTQAFEQAQAQAFGTLAGRVLPADGDKASFTPPEAAVISSLINDFEITDEKLSSVRYIGTYTFRFKKDEVRAWLSAQGLTYTDVGSKPALVLPFYRDGGDAAMLWGNGDNPWLAAWSGQATRQALVPVAVPIGDAQDVADIGDGESETYSPEKLEGMALRYGAGEALFAVAAPDGWTTDAEGQTVPESLTVSLYSADEGPQSARVMTVAAAEARDGESVFEAAARLTRENLQSDWKSRTLVKAEEANRLKARVRFSGMQEWVETQKALARVQGVNDVVLLSLKPSEANVELLFTGSEERLRLALSQADMTLTTPGVDFSAAASPLVYDLYLNRYR